MGIVRSALFTTFIQVIQISGPLTALIFNVCSVFIMCVYFFGFGLSFFLFVFFLFFCLLLTL